MDLSQLVNVHLYLIAWRVAYPDGYISNSAGVFGALAGLPLSIH